MMITINIFQWDLLCREKKKQVLKLLEVRQKFAT